MNLLYYIDDGQYDLPTYMEQEKQSRGMHYWCGYLLKNGKWYVYSQNHCHLQVKENIRITHHQLKEVATLIAIGLSDSQLFEHFSINITN